MKTILLSLLLAVSALAVTPADYATTLSQNVEYSFPVVPAGNRCEFKLTGNFSGASVTPGYIAVDGTFTALGAAVSTASQLGPYPVPAGPVSGKGTPALAITGGVAPTIRLELTQFQGGEIPLNAASIATALGYTPQADLKGVVITKKDGKRTPYPAAADTDTARGDALDAAFAAAVAGDTIDLSPGNYLVDKTGVSMSGLLVQYVILNGMTIRLNGARLYHESGQNTYVMFSAALASLVNDWSVQGPGIIEGTVSSPTGSPSGESAFYLGGGAGDVARRFQISDITVRYFKNTGVLIDSFSWVGGELKFPTGQFSNCHFDTNNVGVDINPGSEFMQFSNCTFSYNKTSINLLAGNAVFVNCQCNGNITDGLVIGTGSNHAHGSWTGGTISHNYGFGIRVATGVTNGFTFTGVHIGGADGTTLNKIQLDGYGINISGGEFDSPIYTTGVNSGINCFENVRITANATSVLTNLFSGSRAKLKIRGCYTMTGFWDQNDILTPFATDAAAGTGGRLAGELYQVTGTGVVMAKQ